jgi:ubiquinone/menaquinone biosynthesis C-methylase UbiE
MKIMTSSYWVLANKCLDELGGRNVPRYKRAVKSKRAKRLYRILELFTEPAGKVALDAGCFVGDIALGLAQLGLKMYGVDTDKKAIRIANVGSRERGVGVDFIVASGEAICFPKDFFDVVISNQVIQHVSDQSLFLREVHRILKPDGLFLLTTVNKYYRLLTSVHGKDISGYGWPLTRLLSWGELRKLLHESGFVAYNMTSWVVKNLDQLYENPEHHLRIKFAIYRLYGRLARKLGFPEAITDLICESLFIVSSKDTHRL